MAPSRRPLAAVGLDDDVAHLVARAGQPQLRVLGGAQEAIEVRLEIVDLPADQPRGVEDAVTAVHHVVVERNHHQRRVGDDAAELARVERGELHRLARAQGAEAGQDIGGGQDLQGGR